MKKVELKKLDLTEFSNFISKLTPLNDSGTIYFSIDENNIATDSHNESKSIVKSIRKELVAVTGSHTVTEKVKFCFYDGRKVLKAFSFLNGNEVNCDIIYDNVDGENFAQKVKIYTNKMSIVLDAADPSLIEFANAPEEFINDVKSVDTSDCSFVLTQNEVLQITKLLDLDNNSEIFIKIDKQVKIGSGSSFELVVDEDFVGISTEKLYRLDKDLFKMVDNSAYTVYPDLENSRIVMASADKNMTVVITLCEEI